MIKLIFSLLLQIFMFLSIGSDANSDLQKSSSLEDLMIDTAENDTLFIDLLSFFQINKAIYLLNKAIEIRLHIKSEFMEFS